MIKEFLLASTLLGCNISFFSCAGQVPISSNKPLVKGVADSLWKNNAVDGLRKYLDLIPPGEYQHYGFNNAEELNRAYLGNPTNLVFAPGTSNLPDTTQILMVPIMVDGQNRAILQLSLDSGEWKANTLGSSGISKRLQEMHNSNPSLINAPIVRVTWKSTDYLVEQLPKGFLAHPLFGGNGKPELWDSIPTAPRH